MTSRVGPKLAAALVVAALVAAGVGFLRGSAGDSLPEAQRVEAASAPEAPTPLQLVEAATGRDAVRPADAESVQATAEPAGAAAPAPEKKLAEARLRARFVDTHGQPWSDVWFRDGDPSGQSTHSGPDGRAELVLHSRSEGEWNVQVAASRAGCATRTIRASLAPGRTVDLGELVLESGVRVAGFVRDESGKALAGATVGISPVDLGEVEPAHLRRHGSMSFERMGAVQSDAQGAFDLEGVAVGRCRLWGHLKGHGYGVSETLELRSGEDLHGVELRLPDLLATDSITGKVVDPAGNPVPKARISLFSKVENHSASTGDEADEKGCFDLLIYLEAPVTLTAGDPEDRWSDVVAHNVMPGTRDVVLQLLEPRWLKVRVVGPADEPVPAARFTCMTGEGGGFQANDVAVKELEAGTYEFRVPGETFSFDVQAVGYLQSGPRDLEPEQLPAELLVRLEAAPVLRGRVMAGGSPLAGAVIEAQETREGSLTFNDFPCIMQHYSRGKATSGADGTFQISLQSTKDVYLRASAPGWAAGLVGPRQSRSGGPSIEIELTRGGTIEGRARTKSGTTIPGTIVGITNGDGHPRTLRAGLDGAFRFDGLTPGKWLVMAPKEEFRTDTTSTRSDDQEQVIEWSCEVLAGRTTFHDLVVE